MNAVIGPHVRLRVVYLSDIAIARMARVLHEYCLSNPPYEDGAEVAALRDMFKRAADADAPPKQTNAG